MPEAKPWPFALAPLRGVLEPLRIPDAPFDPAGAWRCVYTVCVLAPERGAAGEHPQPYGKLSLARKPSAAGRISLEVECSIQTRARAGLATSAALVCAADRLSTPASWTLRSAVVEGGKPVAGTEVEESAEVRGGVLVRRGRGARKLKLAGPFTSNWSLVDAVQRLPFDLAAPLAFDLLEDLDLHKPGQTLRAIPPVTVDLGGRATRLRCFRQTGRGILPTHYWLDERHRLIAAAGALRALVLDPRGIA